MDDYDVFLNHRGPDMKAGFVTHLHEALTSARLNAFLDKKCLVKGKQALESIDAALQMAKVHVAVVSRRYAESKHCLNELVAMMGSGKPVIPVFHDVEPAALRRVEKGPFAAAFQKHKSRETAQQVQEWAGALRKLADITGFCFRFSDHKGDEGELKREVMDAIISVLPQNEALQVKPYLVGLKKHVHICMDKLKKMSGATRLLCLVGMGGVGKTCLAKGIYNHLVKDNKFQAKSFLKIDYNSKDGPCLLSKLRKQLLRDLLFVTNDNLRSYEYWLYKISNQGPLLLVLDNLHDKFIFDELILDTSVLAPGSCIIITSRDQHLLKVFGENPNFYLYEVTTLGCDDSMKLFNWHAFGAKEAPENFKFLAQNVSKACGGLPLALKVVGSNLFDKRSNEDREYIWPEAIDTLKEDLNNDIMSVLRWSYNRLSKSEKLMFVDIACIFYGWKKQEAMEIWKSCKECSSCDGYKTPHTSLRNLIDKSLIIFEDSRGEVLGMHDLLRDMGQNIGNADGSHLCKDKAAKAIQIKNQVLTKVRALNLIHSRKYKFEAENFTKIPSLHFLVLDGCYVSGNLESNWEELRWLRWRNMPLPHLPPVLDLSNLVLLDFSQSTNLANLWAESNSTLEGCRNLVTLDLRCCTSLTTLPESIGRLSRLQVLQLGGCWSLQNLPSSLGQLTALQLLSLNCCKKLEALPETITSLSGLQRLALEHCPSMSKLPTAFGLLTSLTELRVDLVTEMQAAGIRHLNALKALSLSECTDEVVAEFDRSRTLKNLDQLYQFGFFGCKFITKLPKTIGLSTNLKELLLYGCEKLQELPNSIGQLQLLTVLCVKKCSNLETLPDSLGALTSLKDLGLVGCRAIRKLPASIGGLSSLRGLWIQGCDELEPLPESLRQLNALQRFQILDCGSLEGLGALSVLQGLRIWGRTSITELPGSCLQVLDGNFWNPDWYWEMEGPTRVRRNLKELQVVEANDCGSLLLRVQDTQSQRLILQRVFK